MNHEPSLNQIKKEWHGTLNAYLLGFILCFFLTTASFFLVITKALETQHLIYTILGLALIQAACQLRFFLHLGHEAKPRWESYIFYFVFIILLIVVIGTLWIMNDLNERMMMNIKMEMHHD